MAKAHVAMMPPVHRCHDVSSRPARHRDAVAATSSCLGHRNKCYQVMQTTHRLLVTISLLVLAGGAVDASGAVGSRAAPDALVGAWTMAVLACGGVDTSGAVRRRAAPFAVLLVVAVLMLPRRRMDASRAVTRAAAISAFSTHVTLLRLVELYHNLPQHISHNSPCYGRNGCTAL